MPDNLFRAQVIIPMTSGIPEDSVVNTFYFDDDQDDLQSQDDTMSRIMSLLTDFYQSIDSALFPNTVGTEATVRMYNMRDAEPRVPRQVDTFAITPSAGDPLPSEVAVCLSFRAEYVSGVNPARRRGRVFLGPINDTQVVVAGAQLRPATGLRDLIAASADTMAAGLTHTFGSSLRIHWAVYSPTTDATSDIADAFNDVVGGWVDNAFDTQRRRGAEATARSTF